MFTGIIKEIGTIEEINKRGTTNRLVVKTDSLPKAAEIGNSVSVDGTCLTVVDKSQTLLHFDLMRESLKTTTLGLIKKKDKVNLEPSLRAEKDSLGGHIVSGHIDEVGVIKRITRQGERPSQFLIGVSQKAQSLLVKKGSVAVNGISLTVNGIGKDFFQIDIIPHTLKETTMGLKKIGDKVNIEFDIIGKYALKNAAKFKSNGINEEFLKEHGFI